MTDFLDSFEVMASPSLFAVSRGSDGKARMLIHRAEHEVDAMVRTMVKGRLAGVRHEAQQEAQAVIEEDVLPGVYAVEFHGPYTRFVALLHTDYARGRYVSQTPERQYERQQERLFMLESFCDPE